METAKEHPHLPRPFRIPWGGTGLVYVVVAPIAIGGVALPGSDRLALRWGPVAILLGPIAYLLARNPRPARLETSTDPIQDLVIRARQGKSPRVAAAQTERRSRKRNPVKWNVVGLATDDAGDFRPEIGSDRNAVSGVTRCIVHASASAGVRHDVKGKIECSSPDEFDFDILQ